MLIAPSAGGVHQSLIRGVDINIQTFITAYTFSAFIYPFTNIILHVLKRLRGQKGVIPGGTAGWERGRMTGLRSTTSHFSRFSSESPRSTWRCKLLCHWYGFPLLHIFPQGITNAFKSSSFHLNFPQRGLHSWSTDHPSDWVKEYMKEWPYGNQNSFSENLVPE